MGKVSKLFNRFGADNHSIYNYTDAGNFYSELSDNLSFYFMSRGEFFILVMRYILVQPLLLILLDVLWPEQFDDLIVIFVQSWPALLSLVLLMPCYYRLRSQGLSPYLLLVHLFPLINYLPQNMFTLPLCGAFILYLLFINIYPGYHVACERKKEIKNELPGEYPFGLTFVCFLVLNLLPFLYFDMDDAAILLIMASWISFLLAKFHWPVVVINIIGSVGVFLFLSSDFSDLKHHNNIIINAVIKISLLDSVLFLMFSLSLFLNMLFWLEEFQRDKGKVVRQ